MGSPLRHNALISMALSSLYVVLYYLSDWMAGNQVVDGVASVFFLPAFVRLLGFLIVDFWVIPALFVAGLFCVDLGLDMSGKVIVSAFIAVGGPMGVFIVSQLCSLKPSLSNLTPLRLLGLSAGCSLGNSIFYHLGMNAVGVGEHTPIDHFYVFAGDMVGTWTVIYSIKLMMDFTDRMRLNR